MKKKDLPISRKVYADITSRLASALTPASHSEALHMLDEYLTGNPAESADPMATIAFAMIKAELDRAKERSRRARERSAKKRAEKAAEVEKAENTGKAENKVPAVETRPVVEFRPVRRDEDPRRYEKVLCEALEEYAQIVDYYRAKAGDGPGKSDNHYLDRDTFLRRYLNFGRTQTLRMMGLVP